MAVYPVNWNLSLNFFAARRREGDVSPCGATYFARVGKVGKTPPGTRPSELRLHVVPPRFTRPLSPDPCYGGTHP